MPVQLLIRKELLRDYLNYLFTKHNGIYQVRRDHDLGRLICSRVQYSNLPVKHITQAGTVLFHLPDSMPVKSAKNYYLYFSKEDQAKLNDDLEVLFNIDFDRYYLQGKKLNIQQKDIIQDFIITRRLVQMIGDNEMLKKRAYRDELLILKKRTEQLIRKAYYRNESIKGSYNEDNSLSYKTI